MIDPLTALAGIQSAISMVKKAAGVAQDLGSLAPMIAKLFDAKSVATKAMLQAKQAQHEAAMADPNINIWGQMGSLEAQYSIALISLNSIRFTGP